MTGGAAVAAAWLSSATTVPTGPATMPLTIPAGIAQQSAPTPTQIDLEREVTRLTARLEQAPRPRMPARNPFTLRPRVPVVAPVAPPTVSRPQLPSQRELAGVPLGRPTVTLAGIGRERTPTGTRHTAILSVAGRVVLAHVGDDVIGRYQVRTVSTDAVELLDLQEDVSLHLSLP